MPLKSWRLKTYKQERINETCPWGSKFNWSLIRPVVINLFHMESVRSCGVLPLSKFDQRMRRKRNSTIDVDGHLPSGRTGCRFNSRWIECTSLGHDALSCSILLVALVTLPTPIPIVALVTLPTPSWSLPWSWCQDQIHWSNLGGGSFSPFNDVVADAVLQCHFSIATVYI